MNTLCAQVLLTTGRSADAEPVSGRSVWTELPVLLREALRARATGLCSPAAVSCRSDAAPESDGQSEPDALDQVDVRATLAGDGEAYERLVRRYQDPISAYMWRFTRERREWEELVQDVFVEAFFSLRTYAGRAPLLHWLKRLATRVGYRFWKQRDRRRREEPLPAAADPAWASTDGEETPRQAADLVHYLLSRLRPRDRLVMTLTYLEECSVKEMAELTGWSESMVKVQSHRARRRLEEICRRAGIEP